MTSLDCTTEPDSRPAAVLRALVPLLVGGTAGWVLQQAGAEAQFAQIAGTAVAAVTGALLVRRAVCEDERRAARDPNGTRTSRALGPGGTHSDSLPGVRPSHGTVALCAVLAGAAFWLIDLVATWVGLGSLGYWSNRLPYDPSAVCRSVALRSLPLFVPAVFLVAVSIGHRLRARSGPALTAGVLLYTAAVLLTNQVLARHWNTEPLPEDVSLPLLFGAAALLICHLAWWYAGRTQARFDALRVARTALLPPGGGKAQRP
jgi:hypothetical protein